MKHSVGSVIDHYGISVPDIEAAMKKLDGSGAKILSPVRDDTGLFKLAFIEDPFGVKVELVQDAEWPGFHHIHLRVPDPTATLAWYENGSVARVTSSRGRSRASATAASGC